jgi:hypothetical protein
LVGQQGALAAALVGFEYCQSSNRAFQVMNIPISLYTAPELLRNRRGVLNLSTKEMDIYSLGVLIHYVTNKSKSESNN